MLCVCFYHGMEYGELGCAFVNETVICEVNKGYLVGKRLDYSLQTGAG
ncbi:MULTISPECIES: hypothetical protein [unclassified Bartonella]